jgi:hypothetical protein
VGLLHKINVKGFSISSSLVVHQPGVIAWLMIQQRLIDGLIEWMI